MSKQQNSSNMHSSETVDNLTTSIRRKYAHFQRLMTELMWECLIGRDAPIPGVSTLWLYQDVQGQPLRHSLHLPDNRTVEGKPVYNDYAKALYFVEDLSLLPEFKQRLAELAIVSDAANTLAGFQQTKSKHLHYPKLYETVIEVRYWRKQLFDSHRRSKAQVLNLLEKELQDKILVTQQKYEPASSGMDPVLAARYTEIKTLKAQLELVTGLEIETFRERRRYDSVQLHYYDATGAAEQLYVPDVGLIIAGTNINRIDMDATPRTRRPYRGGKKLEPLLRLNGVEVFVEDQWQEAKL
jgi:hypothetical protein